MHNHKFAHDQNVAKYRALLKAAPDDARRKVLDDLLAEEDAKAKLAGWTALYD